MSEKPNTASEFTGWRERIWPIHNYELKKFLPLSFILFAFLYNYTLLRDTKDTLVVNSAGAGAISFLKTYCVTPAAVVFVTIYAKLVASMDREKVFYAIITPFIAFFTLFGFVLYPCIDSLHPSPESVKILHESYPYLSGFIDIYAYWVYSIFYILAEIWGSAAVGLMFWQFANNVVKMSEAKRFYPLFLVVGNVGATLSGLTVVFCSTGIKNFLPADANHWRISNFLMMGIVCGMGILAMALYRYMNTQVMTDPRFYDPEDLKPKKKKLKMGVIDSFKIILTSPELLYITILMIAYGVSINLLELQWKNQIKLWYAGDQGGYNSFMGYFSTAGGILTILFGLFVGSSILRKMSWFFAAIITPMISIVGGGIFFFLVLGRESLDTFVQTINVTTVGLSAVIGLCIVAITKSIKYSLFDPTKEMAYMPLEDTLKTQGKAAVDVIGGRGGKAVGAIIQSTALIIFASKDVMVLAPFTTCVFLVICAMWMFAVKGLSVKVDVATKRKNAELEAAAKEKSEKE
jgi:ATP:ADP antiporter, AAA family